MKKESINTADRKYNIRYYSNSDKNARYNYILPCTGSIHIAFKYSLIS